MPGALDQLTRQLIVSSLTLVGVDQVNIDPTTGSTMRKFIAPFTAQVKGIQGDYITEAGTTPKVDFSLRRGTTKLATVTVVDADTPVHADCNVFIEKGEVLNIFMDNTGNADNDFTGPEVILECQVVVDETAA